MHTLKVLNFPCPARMKRKNTLKTQAQQRKECISHQILQTGDELPGPKSDANEMQQITVQEQCV